MRSRHTLATRAALVLLAVAMATLASGLVALPQTAHAAAVTLSIADMAVAEGAGTTTLTIALSPTSTATTTVDYATSDGTATAPADYTAVVTTTATIPPGATSTTFAVAIVDDAIDEPNETFTVTLSNATGGAVIGQGTASLTILDDDPALVAPPQTSDIVQVTPEGSRDGSALLELPGGQLITVYLNRPSATQGAVYSRTSDDGGATWSAPKIVHDLIRGDPDLVQAPDGTLWLLYFNSRLYGDYNLIARTSTDGGMTWSAERVLDPDPVETDRFYPEIAFTDSGRMVLAFSSFARQVEYMYSDDGGSTWYGPFALSEPGLDTHVNRPDMAIDSSGVIWAVYYGYSATTGEWGVHYQTATDSFQTSTGASWSAPALLVQAGRDPSIARTTEGLVLSWSQDECVGDPLGSCDWNIRYMTRPDATGVWSQPAIYTRFGGRDGRPTVAGLEAGGFALTWHSDRKQSSPIYTPDRTLWFGNPAIRKDLSPPPAVQRIEHFPVANPQAGDEVRVVARIAGNLVGTTTMASTTIEWRKDDLFVKTPRQPGARWG